MRITLPFAKGYDALAGALENGGVNIGVNEHLVLSEIQMNSKVTAPKKFSTLGKKNLSMS